MACRSKAKITSCRSGHGSAREQDVEYETVPVGRILGAMEDAENGVNVIILDACCVFHAKAATDSTAKLPPVPHESCH
jgi:hypothetical protein